MLNSDLQGRYSGMRPFAEFFQHLGRVIVLRIQLQGFTEANNSVLFIAAFHISFPQTIICIARLRIGDDVQLEDLNRSLDPLCLPQIIA